MCDCIGSAWPVGWLLLFGGCRGIVVCVVARFGCLFVCLCVCLCLCARLRACVCVCVCLFVRACVCGCLVFALCVCVWFLRIIRPPVARERAIVPLPERYVRTVPHPSLATPGTLRTHRATPTPRHSRNAAPPPGKPLRLQRTTGRNNPDNRLGTNNSKKQHSQPTH